MGLFDRFKKKEPKKAKRTKKNVRTSVGTRVGTKKKTVKKTVKAVGTDILLKDWMQTIKKVENHPLSQVRIINTSILEQLTEILASIDSKLNKLNKLDEIVSLLDKERIELDKAGIPTETLDIAIAKLKGLSTKDKEAIEVMKKHKSLTTENFAKKIGLSRSTASTRLNKLHTMGILNKTTNGKKILYKIDKKL
jgi:uncharacterized membrane protein